LNVSGTIAQVILQLASRDSASCTSVLGSDAVQYARLAQEKWDSDAKAGVGKI
jgi:hypothetical protein